MLALRFRCTEMVFYVWFFFIVTRWFLLFHGLTTLSTNFSFSSARFLIIGGAVVTGLSSWILSDRFPLGTWPSRMVIVLVLAIACCIFAHSHYQLRGHMKVLCKSFFKSFYLIILPWIMLLLWPVHYRNIPLTVTFYIYLIMEGPLIFWFFDGCDKLCGKQSSQSSPDAHPVEGYCTTQEELYSQGSTI
uniref:Uncharacterized protein n=1 Tax=Musca domestica TaxID=7370 RepID=A0A1I8MRV8_MUSDO